MKYIYGFFELLLCSILFASLSLADVPESIRKYSAVTVSEDKPAAGIASFSTSRNISINIEGRIFNLSLTPYVVTSGSINSDYTFYKGTANESGTATAGFLGDTLDHAVVQENGEFYFFETYANSPLIGYLAEDLDPGFHPAVHCGTGNEGSAFSGFLSELPKLAAQTGGAGDGGKKIIEMGITADFGMTMNHGSQLERFLSKIINMVNGIYAGSGLPHEFQAIDITVHSQFSDPYSFTTDGETLLSEHEVKDTDRQEFDLAPLFTGRQFANNLLGMARIHGVCNEMEENVTVISDSIRSLGDTFMAILTAHEFGHTVGANHDGRDAGPFSLLGCEPQEPPEGFVMSATINTGGTTFSGCSVDSINHLATLVSCLEDAGPEQEAPVFFYYEVQPGFDVVDDFDVTVNVSDNGTIERVEYYFDDELIHTETPGDDLFIHTEVFDIDDLDDTPGTHQMKTCAIDNEGREACVSRAVEVGVDENPPELDLIITVTQPFFDGVTMTPPQIVIEVQSDNFDEGLIQLFIDQEQVVMVEIEASPVEGAPPGVKQLLLFTVSGSGNMEPGRHDIIVCATDEDLLESCEEDYYEVNEPVGPGEPTPTPTPDPGDAGAIISQIQALLNELQALVESVSVQRNGQEQRSEVFSPIQDTNTMILTISGDFDNLAQTRLSQKILRQAQKTNSRIVPLLSSFNGGRIRKIKANKRRAIKQIKRHRKALNRLSN